jgi:hypothetical protein
MDPKQALIDADQAISDLDLDTAADRLFDYYQWRTGGGFEPSGDWYRDSARGDFVAADCVRRLQDRR